MSTSVIRGKIKNFSPKPDEDYYGILVDTGDRETWLNGRGDVPDSLDKGQVAKFEVNEDEFIDIKNIEVVEASEGEETRSQQPAEGGNQQSQADKSPTAPPFTNEQIRILTSIAFKEACETVRKNGADSIESQGEHLEQVSELTNGYANLLEAQMKNKVNGK